MEDSTIAVRDQPRRDGTTSDTWAPRQSEAASLALGVIKMSDQIHMGGLRSKGIPKVHPVWTVCAEALLLPGWYDLPTKEYKNFEVVDMGMSPECYQQLQLAPVLSKCVHILQVRLHQVEIDATLTGDQDQLLLSRGIQRNSFTVAHSATRCQIQQGSY